MIPVSNGKMSMIKFKCIIIDGMEESVSSKLFMFRKHAGIMKNSFININMYRSIDWWQTFTQRREEKRRASLLMTIH